MSLDEALRIPGAYAVALITADEPALTWWGRSPTDGEAQAAAQVGRAAADLVRLSSVNILTDTLDDVLVTSAQAFHVLRLVPTPHGQDQVAHLMLRRAGANLAMARHDFRRLTSAYATEALPAPAAGEPVAPGAVAPPVGETAAVDVASVEKDATAVAEPHPQAELAAAAPSADGGLAGKTSPIPEGLVADGTDVSAVSMMQDASLASDADISGPTGRAATPESAEPEHAAKPDLPVELRHAAEADVAADLEQDAAPDLPAELEDVAEAAFPAEPEDAAEPDLSAELEHAGRAGLPAEPELFADIWPSDHSQRAVDAELSVEPELSAGLEALATHGPSGERESSAGSLVERESLAGQELSAGPGEDRGMPVADVEALPVFSGALDSEPEIFRDAVAEFSVGAGSEAERVDGLEAGSEVAAEDWRGLEAEAELSDFEEEPGAVAELEALDVPEFGDETHGGAGHGPGADAGEYEDGAGSGLDEASDPEQDSLVQTEKPILPRRSPGTENLPAAAVTAKASPAAWLDLLGQPYFNDETVLERVLGSLKRL